MGLCENCKITMCRAERDDVIGCAEFVAKDTNVLTNADRIRAMSDEELAEFLADEVPHGDCNDCQLCCATFDGDEFDNSCTNAFYRWLKQPAEE